MKKYFSVAYLFLANLAVVIAGAVCIPLLAKIYTPEQFGKWSIIVSAASLATIVTTLQFEQFIPASRYRYQAAAFANAILWLTVVSAAFFVGGGLVFSWLTEHMEWFSIIVICTCLMILLNINQLLQFLLTRSQSYKTLANRIFLFVLVRFGVQFCLGLQAVAALINGLVAGELGGRLFQTAVINPAQLQRLRKDIGNLRRRRGFFKPYIASRWLLKGVHATFARILGDGTYLILPMVIGLMYDINSVGQFNIAHNAVLSVVNAVLITVSSVFFGETSRYYYTDRQRFRRHFFKTIAIMSLLGICMYVFCLYFAGYVINFIFHAAWKDVYSYFMILLPSFCVQMALGATFNTLNIIGKSKYALYVNIFWNLLFWPFTAYCTITHQAILFFLWGFNLIVIARYLANFLTTIYWVKQ